MYPSIKRNIYLLLDPQEGGTIWDKVVNTCIVTLIVANTLAVIIETVENIYIPHKVFFDRLEKSSIIFFTIEYLLRVWSITSASRYESPVLGRLKYLFSFGGVVDLAAILPFYLPMLVGFDFRFLRILRLIRFVRLFKIGRYLNASKVIAKVFESKKEQLFLSLIMTMFLIIVASSIMYFAEHDAQPDKFSSIPSTMWWSVATLTTVGYGDVYPITILGKTMTALISILGMGLFALPAGILASGFSDEFKVSREEKKCPHCGKEISH